MVRFLLLLSTVLAALGAATFYLKRKYDLMIARNQSAPRFPVTKGLLVFILPLPVLLAAIAALARGNIGGLFDNAVCAALFLSGAVLLRRGLRAEMDYIRRQVARAPWPFKTLGCSVLALATALTAWTGANHPPGVALAFGLLAWLGCYLTYGFDPRRSKRFTDRDGVDSTDRVLEALTQAEQTIATIEQTTRNISNAELNSRLRRIIAQARQILKMLEEDPRDLRRARKFLNVYLDGARQVTEGYAKMHGRASTPELEDSFRRVLVTIEEVFNEQQQKLLEADITDLDVQIEVLSTQLKREGVV